MTQNQNEIIITEEESKKCKICNKVFESNRLMIWHVRKEHQIDFENYILKVFYNGIRPVCLKTGNKLSFKAHKLGPWFSNFSKNNFPRKPHSEESKEKIKLGCEKTSMEKYGVKNVFSTDWCKDKIKNTMEEKYGVDNIMKLPEMRIKAGLQLNTEMSFTNSKKTCNEKYGADCYRKSLQHKLSVRKSNFKRIYKSWEGFQKVLQDTTYNKIKCVGNYDDVLNGKPLKFECNICGNIWEEIYITSPVCSKCQEKFLNARSNEESALMKWLKEVSNINFIPNKRFNINGKIYEADICFESIKLIIELNGLFWHSEKAGKDRNYHINKLNSLESIGYTVLQIFEDEWLFKTNLVKNKILHKLGLNKNLPKIYARNCIIKKIDNSISNIFLENTHIQGGAIASYCYGAYYNDELVAVMTFSKPRITMGNKVKKENEYEMVRFSTSEKYRVIAISGKLLSYFIKEVKPLKITSYADRRWSNKTNNLYEKIGFKILKETNPNYWYIKKYRREYRFNYTKKKLVNMGYSSDKTEWEIMKELGYDRIWDCGHVKYQLDVN